MDTKELWVREDFDGRIELSSPNDSRAIRFVRDEVNKNEWIDFPGSHECPVDPDVIVDVETGKGFVSRTYATNAPWYNVNRYRVVVDKGDIEVFNRKNAQFMDALNKVEARC